ncbi:MAG: glycosyltransferase [Candidatus Sumerlaeaceae bacterium]|nr:glycosyltransferase [Candidatus Sumerlaeaceae bacterium]
MTEPSWHHALAVVVLTVYFSSLVLLSCFGGHRYLMLYLFYRHRRQQLPEMTPLAEWPTVTLQLPVFNERYVVERLIDSVCRIDYPREKLQIQVLDDSTDETQALARAAVEQWALRGINVEYIHRDNREGYKAGALENGLKSATGEFVAIFDADFFPEPVVLRRVMPAFAKPRIGMVQMRWEHLNRNASLLTRLQSIMLDGHFAIEHVARSLSGRFFNFNGTAGVWRKAAIEDAGGWKHDTLTEDLDLSYRAQLRGWKFVYLPALAVPAELPEEINAFKSQQHRWTKGAIQTALKLLPTIWRSRIPFALKMEATTHLTNNIAYLMMLLVSVLMLPAMVMRGSMNIVIPVWVDAAMFLASTVSVAVFYIASQAQVLQDWKGQWRYVPLMMSLGIGLCVSNAKAVLEALFGVQSGFVRTPKTGFEKPATTWMMGDYFTKTSAVAALEMALAVYYLYIVVHCALTGNFLTLPFMVLFLFGFGYVGGLSVMSLVRKRQATAAVAAKSTHEATTLS